MPNFADPTWPTGHPLPHWRPPAAPVPVPLSGDYCQLAPLDPAAHAEGLFQAIVQESDPKSWTYLPAEPPTPFSEFQNWLHGKFLDPSFRFYVIQGGTPARLLGTTAFMRLDPPNGVIEVGWVMFGPALQRTPAGTEAIYLQLKHAFELGYRRVEWKCDSLNAPSRSAALRYGFTFEGIFRQAIVVKGRNRDTAWYSMLDREWPERSAAFVRWLSPDNFDAQGRQRRSLAQCRESRA
jgi:RimJ/RimL family protein N-acetyltransferase